MARKPSRTAADFVPAKADLSGLRTAARTCRGCDLYQAATQTVFGDGDPNARVLLVGEQPGDQEDQRGEPFVGPAGRLLDRALEDAGIDRTQTYVTNAVKHFKFVPAERGKRRLHKTPSRTETLACRPWLEAEVQVLDPDLLICLGATAAKAVLGPTFRVSRQRGVLLPWPDDFVAASERARVLATIHPSAALRAANREEMYDGLVADLRVAAGALD